MAPQALRIGLRRRDQGWFVFSSPVAAEEPAGLIAVDSVDPVDGVGNLWFLLGNKSQAGKGLTSMAIDEFCTTNPLKLAVLTAWVAAPNAPSLKCLERAGFSRIGRIENAVVLPEGRFARILFARNLEPPAGER
jgi:RimJ/RimL family protein N-acetyltransferase